MMEREDDAERARHDILIEERTIFGIRIRYPCEQCYLPHYIVRYFPY